MATPLMETSERVTLADVAALAQVRRPVVSMWRKRYATGDLRFPQPVARVSGIDRFDRSQVLAWLEVTGRGGPRHVAAEAVLHGLPPVPTSAGYTLAHALLTLSALTGESIAALDQEDAADLAADVDEEDHALRREIARATDADVVALGPYVDALLDCSFGPADALDRLAGSAPRFGVPPDTSGLSDAVRRLVWTLAEAVAGPLRGLAVPSTPSAAVDREGRLRCPLVDPTGCSPLALPVDDRDWVDGLVLARSSEAGGSDLDGAVRSTWRRLWAAGLAVRGLPESGIAGLEGPAVVVASYPDATGAVRTPEEIFEAVDEIVRGLAADQRAIIVGPAEALTDDLRAGRATRDYVLRSGALRAAYRLPTGVRPAMPLAHNALWVLGAARGARSLPHRRTAVADLAGLDLAAVTDDLVADTLAAIDDQSPEARGDAPARQQTAQSRSHVLRVANYELTDVVVNRPAVVPRHVRAQARLGGAPSAPAVEAVRADLPGVDLHVTAGPEARPRGAVSSVAELLSSGRLRVGSGARLTEGLARPDAVGPPVVGPAELCGTSPVGQRRVSLLELTAAHPNVTLTEAGDVVFGLSPHLTAWVDAAGGSVVEFPARVLRVLPDPEDNPPRPQRILPRVLAQDLLRGPARAWRSTAVRLIPAEAADALGRSLETAHSARRQALERARDLELLADALAGGVVAGEFTITTNAAPDRHPDQASPQEGH